MDVKTHEMTRQLHVHACDDNLLGYYEHDVKKITNSRIIGISKKQPQRQPKCHHNVWQIRNKKAANKSFVKRDTSSLGEWSDEDVKEQVKFAEWLL